MQRLAAGDLVAQAPAGSEIWLDGGHNPDGGRMVAAALADLEERVSRPLVLIMGMLATKDTEGFLRNFAGLARCLIAVPIRPKQRRAGGDARRNRARIGIAADASDDVAGAGSVRSLALDPPPRILITGSLYLAGEVLAANGTVPEVTAPVRDAPKKKRPARRPQSN